MCVRSLLTIVLLLVFMSMADLDKFPEDGGDEDAEERNRKKTAKAELELREWWVIHTC